MAAFRRKFGAPKARAAIDCVVIKATVNFSGLCELVPTKDNPRNEDKSFGV